MRDRDRRFYVVVRKRGIEVFALTFGDAEHEKTNAAEHRENDEQKEEDGPACGISAASNHACAAGGTRKECWKKVHEDNGMMTKEAELRYGRP